MAIDSIPGLIEVVRECELLTPTQAADLSKIQGRFVGPRDLAQDLVHRNWLTSYQVNQLFLESEPKLKLGPYVLLKLLGEGGMGQVFKACHSKMGRIVALKIIRHDKTENKETVRRFFREMQAVAELDHPNIVHAYDADEVDGTYFFAMEYIHGPDLGRLVKQKGPLPVRSACDFMRQAALGLQHAYEKGLVHRDIKPSNLLLAATPSSEQDSSHSGLHKMTGPVILKILDLGLARLQDHQLAEDESRLTQVQAVLGTPDFIAPEQARNARQADARSDLYSLGCTFYYLLTAQVPFPGGTPMEKLLKHYLEQTVRLEELRPTLPTAVGDIVRRLMEKDPEQRYQTPEELAAMLTAYLKTRRSSSQLVGIASGSEVAQPVTPPEEKLPAEPETEDTLAELSAALDTATAVAASSSTGKSWGEGRSRNQNPWLVPVTVGSVVFLLTLLLLVIFIVFGLD